MAKVEQVRTRNGVRYDRTTGIRRADLGKVMSWQLGVARGHMSMREYRSRINGLNRTSGSGH